MSSQTSSKTVHVPSSQPHSGHLAASLDRVTEAIGRAGDLPTLPSVAIEVSRLAANPVTAMTELVRIIHNDPALTAKILRVANSAFYGMSRHVESLNTALVVLGMRELINLVHCISVFRAFPVKVGQPTFDRKAFWVHSAGCGELARAISGHLKLRRNTEAFTAGLLHDLGKIILDQYFHDDFMEALKRSHSENISMIEAEDHVLGVNHAELGAWLAEMWSLPRSICDVISHHHNPEVDAGENRQLVALIRLADLFCKHAGVGFSGDKADPSVANDPAWKILSEVQPEIKDWDVKQFMYELKDNVDRAREFVSIALEP